MIEQAYIKTMISSVRTTERVIYSDYSEISPWNSSYLKHYKQVQKPTWRYFMGTMPDLHYLIKSQPLLLVICGFLRSFGMWLGISNPVLGLFIFIACALDNWYNVAYASWAIICVMFWSWAMSVPKELLYNGLYPGQGMLMGLLIYSTSTLEAQFDNLLPQMIYIFFLALLNLILFQGLCSFFVKLMNISPMMIAPLVVATLYKAMKHESTFLVLPEQSADPTNSDPTSPHYFNGDMYTVFNAIAISMSHLVFSNNLWSAFALSLGTAITSPILLLTMWTGSIVSTITAVAISPVWIEVLPRYYLFAGIITMSVICGFFFVPTPFSLVIGIMCTIFTTFVTIALHGLLEPLYLRIIGAWATYIVCISLYAGGGAFSSLIPVELAAMTTPEDHLRRFILSRRILKDLKIKSQRTLSPVDFRRIEQCILPVMMCSYAKNGLLGEMKKLLDLGADANCSDYDGRCALHIAAAENKKEIVYMLLKYAADINKEDCYHNTAVSAALLEKNFDLALYLYKKGGRLTLEPAKMASLLCYVVYQGQPNDLRAWLKCGADATAQDYDNRTALHVAYSLKKTEMVDILLEHLEQARKGLKAVNCQGATILENTCALDFTEEKNESRKMPAREEKRKSPKVLYREKRKGAKTGVVYRPKLDLDPVILHSVINSIIENDDETKKQALLPSLLCEVVYAKDHTLLKQLLSQYGSASIQTFGDYDVRTPLHIASVVGNLEAVKLLLCYKVDINSVDRFGNTPLFEACLNGQTDVAAYLRANGAELAPGYNPHCYQLLTTEICWAVYNRDFELISRFIENGASTCLVDYDGRSWVDIARDLKDANMLDHINKLLSQNGSTKKEEREVKQEEKEEKEEKKLEYPLQIIPCDQGAIMTVLKPEVTKL